MTSELPHYKKSRWFAAHATIALLSLAGAVGLQWLWTSPLPAGTESWRTYFAAVLISTTTWLVATAWLHGSLTSSNAPHGRVLLQSLADIATCGVCAFILAQGHTSGFALSGVWPICPLLIAISAPSGLILLATALSAGQHGRSSSRNVAGVNVARVLRLVGMLAVLTSLLLVANL